MLETVVAQQVLRAVLGQALARGAKRVRAIWLEVGGLEGLGRNELADALALKSGGTPLEGARLDVMLVRCRRFCPRCKTSQRAPAQAGRGPERPPPLCRACGGPLRLDGGRGFAVRQATMEV